MNDFIRVTLAYLAFVATAFLLLPIIGPALPAAVAIAFAGLGAVGVAHALLRPGAWRTRIGLTTTACLLLCLPAFAADGDLVGLSSPASVPAWAPAIVPLLVWLIKFGVNELIPDSVIKKIRDELLPLVAVIVGTLGTSIASGEPNWTQGPLVGLAGVGLHQLWRQFGKALDS